MRSAVDRGRRLRGALVATGIALLLAACSLAPARAAHAAGPSTVRGTVQSGSTLLAGVPVGFWSRTGHVRATTTTAADGSFALRVPSGVRGYAYAGARPDAATAIFAVHGASYARGVIGAEQGRTSSYRIAQGHASATAAGLAGGAPLRFRLQRPGRLVIAGGAQFAGTGDSVGLVQVQRLNGGFVSEVLAAGASGTMRSGLLVPGAYRLQYVPQPPLLRRTVGVTVRAGGTTRPALPAFSRGATVRGAVTVGGAPVGGVVVDLVQSPASTGEATTDAAGRYTISGLAAGAYRLTVGVNNQGDPEDLPEDPNGLRPATSDDVLVATGSLTVSADHADQVRDVAVQPAAHLVGTVSAPAGAGSRVVLEDTAGHVVRVAVVNDGRYRLGGLTPGTAYRVIALAGSGATATYASRSVTATAGTATVDLAPRTPALTLRGSVARATGGAVSLVAASRILPRIGAAGPITRSGAFTVRGLIPATWSATVQAGGRLESRPVAVELRSSVSRDLVAGARPGAYTVRFVSGAAPARRILGTAADAAGDRIDLDAPAGVARASGVQPGRYAMIAGSFRGANGVDAPAADGPWWYGPPHRSFSIVAGRSTDDGTVALHVHAR